MGQIPRRSELLRGRQIQLRKEQHMMVGPCLAQLIREVAVDVVDIETRDDGTHRTVECLHLPPWHDTLIGDRTTHFARARATAPRISTPRTGRSVQRRRDDPTTRHADRGCWDHQRATADAAPRARAARCVPRRDCGPISYCLAPHTTAPGRCSFH